MSNCGTKKLLLEYFQNIEIDFDEILNYLEIFLREDEYTDLDRIGEYGKQVPTIVRQSSQPDQSAPMTRINAFYTFCAYEYYTSFSPQKNITEITRISNFVKDKLKNFYYYRTRSADGYTVGGYYHDSQYELNIRHTLALALILAAENTDQKRLEKIKELLLADDSQSKEGGWFIWETDKKLGNAPDPVCSGYALILLVYFLEYSLNNSEKEILQEKISITVRYMIKKLDIECFLWLSPRNDYFETLQMSTWYLSLLHKYLIEIDPAMPIKIMAKINSSISSNKIHTLIGHPIGTDIILRIIILTYRFSQYTTFNELKRALQVLIEQLNNYKGIKNITTYTICNLLYLLQENNIKSKKEIKSETVDTLVRLLGSLIRGYFGP